VNTTKGTGEFNIPLPAREAWERVANDRGSREDLRAVLDSLKKAWSFDSADPRGFQSWLADQGLSREALLPLVLAERKTAYATEQTAKVPPTKEVVEGLLNGVYASEFFSSMETFSSDFRILAYQTAILAYRNEGIAFALAALSQESQWVIDATTKSLPGAPILKAFSSFLTLKSTRACLGLRADREIAVCENPTAIDQLFCLATNPPKATAEELSRLPQASKEKLVSIAEALLQNLPDRGFGQFAKVNISLFICNAAPDGRLFETAKHTLISTGEPAVADFLELLGAEHVLAELQKSNIAQQPGRERYVAALIDAWRRLSDHSIREFENQTAPIKSKVPVIGVALNAGTASKSPKHEQRFERLLARSLQTAKDQSVREWLLRNPEFVKYLPVGRASLQTVRTILDVARTIPAQALAVSSQLLQELRETAPQQYWEEAIRTLAAIGGSKADEVFRAFVIDRIKAGERSHIRDLLTREPAASLLRRNFLTLLDSGAEQEWATLFDFLIGRSAESTLLSLLESASLRSESLAAWIANRFIPDLLESGSLSPGFHRSITRTDMTAAIAKVLSGRVLADIEEIRSFKGIWLSKRSEIKIKLLSRVQTGLRIALNTLGRETGLHKQLSKVLDAANDWAAAPPPPLDPSIQSTGSTEAPAPLSSEDSLRGVFAHRVPSALEFTLIAGQNPWVVDVIAGHGSGPWPKAEVLFDQIVDRFVHVSQVRKRAQQQLENVSSAVRIELAVVLRDILADIESELAGYFAFRDILDENGLHPVLEKLGTPIGQRHLSSEKHKLIRDPGARGKLRVFGLGIRIDDRVVGSGLVMNSGDDDDCG
jgi:hypothetical protein